MKLTKKQALSLVKVLSKQDYLYDDLDELNRSMEDFILGEDFGTDEEVDDDEEYDWSHHEEHDDFTSGKDEDNEALNEAHFSPEHMASLPSVAVSVISSPEDSMVDDSEPVKVSFNQFENELDLCINGMNEAANITRIKRGGKTLAVMCDDSDEWYRFNVTKFPKEWTHKLPVNMMFKAEGSK